MIFFKILWKSRVGASSTQTQNLSKVSNPIEKTADTHFMCEKTPHKTTFRVKNFTPYSTFGKKDFLNI